MAEESDYLAVLNLMHSHCALICGISTGLAACYVMQMSMDTIPIRR